MPVHGHLVLIRIKILFPAVRSRLLTHPAECIWRQNIMWSANTINSLVAAAIAAFVFSEILSGAPMEIT